MVSIYTLVLMSLDRFLAVVYAVESMTWRTEANCKVAIAIGKKSWFYRVPYFYRILRSKGFCSTGFCIKTDFEWRDFTIKGIMSFFEIQSIKARDSQCQNPFSDKIPLNKIPLISKSPRSKSCLAIKSRWGNPFNFKIPSLKIPSLNILSTKSLWAKSL